MNGFAKELIRKATELLKSNEFCERNKNNRSDFTRNRKLSFTSAVSITLGIVVKSLQLAVDEFREAFMTGVDSYTKQAFSQARAKINSTAYKEIFRMTAHEAFKRNAIPQSGGRRFFAIDGSDLMLPQSAEIRQKFKPVSGSRLPHARASLFVDVQNGYVLDACFDSIEVDERTMAFAHLVNVKEYLGESDIVLFDRGYPSKKLISYMVENGINFIARLQKSFSTNIDENVAKDFSHRFVYNKKEVLVRICKEPKDGGADTVLMSNLFDSDLTSSDIYGFYTKRWCIETGYLELKVRLEAEKFSGKTVESLEQDFFARLFLINIEAAIKGEANDIISSSDEQKPRKYPRKANENILLGRLRNKIWKCLLLDDEKERDAIIDRLINDASKTTVDIRKKRDRVYPRAFRSHKRITESPKRCL